MRAKGGERKETVDQATDESGVKEGRKRIKLRNAQDARTRIRKGSDWIALSGFMVMARHSLLSPEHLSPHLRFPVDLPLFALPLSVHESCCRRRRASPACSQLHVTSERQRVRESRLSVPSPPGKALSLIACQLSFLRRLAVFCFREPSPQSSCCLLLHALSLSNFNYKRHQC